MNIQVTDLLFSTKQQLQGALEPVDPSLLMLRRRARSLGTAPFTLVTVYRRRNAGRVRHLLDTLPAGCRALLWALDEIAPELGASTVGSGSGGRFALMNAMLSDHALAADEWLLLVDDDVEFVRGGLTDVVAGARLLGLDVTQPTHGRGSSYTWDHTRHRALSLGRLHRFVEIGPVVAMSPAARSLLIPLPEDTLMGWGTEAVWAARTELQLGVLDAVVVRHVGTVGGQYEQAGEQSQFDSTVAEPGSLEELMRERGRWRAWEPRRPWSDLPAVPPAAAPSVPLDALPEVSAVVTTRNRVAGLPTVLAPLLADPACAEVIVVSDASTDGTAAYLTELADREPKLRPVILEENVGQPRARTLGIQRATSQIALSLDDDVLVSAGCVTRHAARHSRGDVDVLVGFMPAPPVAASTDPAVWNYGTHYLERTRAWAGDPAGILASFWGGHFSVDRKRYLDAIEGFAVTPDFHEDLDLGQQLARHDLRAAFDPTLTSRHLYTRSYPQSLVDHRRSGIGLRDLERKHGRSPAEDLPDGGGPARQAVVKAALSAPALGNALLAGTRLGVRLGGLLGSDALTLKSAGLGWQLSVLDGYHHPTA